MTTIASPRALPHKGTPAPEAISTTADVIELVKRSNHATAFAGWTVTTIAMGLVLQAGTLRSVESFTVTLVLIGLLLPVLAATARTGLLLADAGRAASVAGGASEPTGAAAGAVDAANAVGRLEATAEVPLSATQAASAAKAAGIAEYDAAVRHAQDRLWSALTSARTRETLARRALVWAYGSGCAFLTWSLTVVLLASR